MAPHAAGGPPCSTPRHPDLELRQGCISRRQESVGSRKHPRCRGCPPSTGTGLSTCRQFGKQPQALSLGHRSGGGSALLVVSNKRLLCLSSSQWYLSASSKEDPFLLPCSNTRATAPWTSRTTVCREYGHPGLVPRPLSTVTRLNSSHRYLSVSARKKDCCVSSLTTESGATRTSFSPA